MLFREWGCLGNPCKALRTLNGLALIRNGHLGAKLEGLFYRC